MEHHRFISLFTLVLTDAAKAVDVELKLCSLFWLSGVSGISPNLIRVTVLFKALTPEICNLHTHTAFTLFRDPRQCCPPLPGVLKPLAIAIR